MRTVTIKEFRFEPFAGVFSAAARELGSNCCPPSAVVNLTRAKTDIERASRRRATYLLIGASPLPKGGDHERHEGSILAIDLLKATEELIGLSDRYGVAMARDAVRLLIELEGSYVSHFGTLLVTVLQHASGEYAKNGRRLVRRLLRVAYDDAVADDVLAKHQFAQQFGQKLGSPAHSFVWTSTVGLIACRLADSPDRQKRRAFRDLLDYLDLSIKHIHRDHHAATYAVREFRQLQQTKDAGKVALGELPK